MEDEGLLKTRVERYQQRIFSLVLGLIGGDRDKAYEIAVSSFVKAVRSTSIHDKGDVFLLKLVNTAVKKSRHMKVIPSFDESDFQSLPSEKRKSLFLVRRAIQSLPFEGKALLLLRNQLHLSYKNIAAILCIPENSMRLQAVQTQDLFREKLKEILSSAG